MDVFLWLTQIVDSCGGEGTLNLCGMVVMEVEMVVLERGVPTAAPHTATRTGRAHAWLAETGSSALRYEQGHFWASGPLAGCKRICALRTARWFTRRSAVLQLSQLPKRDDIKV